jgi:hypothetical protein
MFVAGDKVMLLLPTPGKPLHAKFQGPYTVLEQVEPVVYKLATTEKRKQERICHVNLLKPYVERNWSNCLTNSLLDTTGSPPDLINELECEKIETGPDVTSSDTDVFHLSHLSDYQTVIAQS